RFRVSGTRPDLRETPLRSRAERGLALSDEIRTLFTGQNRGILSVMYGSVEADQDFSFVLADWSGVHR
ncbi:hypothetical protein, partial [Streptomyces virginiae]|uniref:hypothetical protein n=1 Tax=Streptomyces virginiae TaxID=1961 RepID=UPI0035DFC70A